MFAAVTGRIRRLKRGANPEDVMRILDAFRGQTGASIIKGTTAGAQLGAIAGGDILTDMIDVDLIDDARALLVNDEAAAWAGRRSGELITGIDRTTRDAVRLAVEQNIEAGGTPRTLAARLNGTQTGYGALSPKRAMMIAVTETTRSYAEGNLIAWRESGVVETITWHTANDDIVCPVCAPLGGLKWSKTKKEASPASINAQRKNAATTSLANPSFEHPGGAGPPGKFAGNKYRNPPAHPRCRCWLVPVVDGARAATQTVVPKPAPKPKPKPVLPKGNPFDPATYAAVGRAMRQRIDPDGKHMDAAVESEALMRKILPIVDDYNRTGKLSSETYAEWRSLHRRLKELRIQSASVLSDGLISELKRMGVTFERAPKIKSTGKGAAAVKSAVRDRMPDHMIEAVEENPTFRPLTTRKVTRGEADSIENRVYTSGDTAEEQARVAIHEYLHIMQGKIQDFDLTMAQLYARRTAGEERTAIYGKKSGKVVGLDRGVEAGRRDDFISAYQGKTYISVSGEKEWAKEMMTMTGESMLTPTDNTLAMWADTELSDTFMGLMARRDWKPSQTDLSEDFHYGQYNPSAHGAAMKEAWNEIQSTGP